ncbi:MAG: hypothetical protein ACW97X_14070, partial [Candidatus Hodarchaeales archaeon]
MNFNKIARLSLAWVIIFIIIYLLIGGQILNFHIFVLLAIISTFFLIIMWILFSRPQMFGNSYGHLAILQGEHTSRIHDKGFS